MPRNSRPTLDTLLFDLDGTLINSIPLIVASYHHTLDVHCGKRVDDAHWIARIGRTLWDTLREWAGDDAELDAMVETYRSHNLAHHDEAVSAYDGIVETLDTLATQGFALGVVTSKITATARRGLRVCGLERYFQFVVGYDDVERHKPHPEPVATALDHYGTPPHRAAYVGDSEHDIASGNAAGVYTVLAGWGPVFPEPLLPAKAVDGARPWRWIDRPNALTDLFASPPQANRA